MSKETQEWKNRVWRAQTSAILSKKWQLTKWLQQTFVPKNFLGATRPKSSRSVAGGPWALQHMDRNLSRGLPSLCTKENTAKKVTKIMRIWSNWSSDTLPLGAYNHSGRLSGNTNKMSYIPAVWSSNSTPNINLEKSRPMCSETKKKNMHCYYIHIMNYMQSQKLKTIQLFINGRMDIQIWYNHTVEDCSARKRNKLVIRATTWMTLKNTASKGRQTPKSTRYIIPFIWMQE